jgi:hypothetical protein
MTAGWSLAIFPRPEACKDISRQYAHVFLWAYCRIRTLEQGEFLLALCWSGHRSFRISEVVLAAARLTPANFRDA